jgi:hypothetical protein
MYALAVVALFLVTPSTASPSITGRDTSACTKYGTPDQDNFSLWGVPDTGGPHRLALGDQSYIAGWIGVFSLPLFAKIVLICLLQVEHDMAYVISLNFNMTNGGITAITAEGVTTGVSNEVPNTNGFLSFALAGDTSLPTPDEGVYCVLVSVRTESLGVCDWS